MKALTICRTLLIFWLLSIARLSLCQLVMYRQKQRPQLVRAASDRSWLLYSVVRVVWLQFSKYVVEVILLPIEDDCLRIIYLRNLILQYFANSISRLLLPVDGAHAASCEEMANAMSKAESAAHRGLQQCIDTVMAEV